MKRMVGFIGVLFAFSTPGWSQTLIETESVRQMQPTNTLGTCQYAPTSGESGFYKKLASTERITGSMMEDYDIHRKSGYVSWCGIVRGISRPQDGRWRLLLEHKFFDGLTDCHIMLVDIAGSGDFLVEVESADLAIPALALVRVYGMIKGEEAGKPVLAADFIRVWPWRMFTFTDLIGEDRTNPRWKDACSIDRRDIYVPWPDEKYYRAVLGDPREYGLALKENRS